MTRKKDPAETGLPAVRDDLSAFAPVPRQRNRRDGWTPARQRGFIARLASGAAVRAAANAVGMTPQGAYHLRRQPGAESFAAAWQAALETAAGAIPPPVLAPMTMQEMMLILRAQARRRAGPERVIHARVRSPGRIWPADQDAEG